MELTRTRESDKTLAKKDDLHPVAAVVPSARIIEHNVCVIEVYFPHFSAISRSVVVAWDRVPLLSAHMTGFPDQPTPALYTLLPSSPIS